VRLSPIGALAAFIGSIRILVPAKRSRVHSEAGQSVQTAAVGSVSVLVGAAVVAVPSRDG
jgi:hypothetical protein